MWYDNIMVILRAWPVGDEYEIEYRWYIISDFRNVGCDCIVLRIRDRQDAQSRMFGVCHLGNGFDMDSRYRRLGLAIGLRETH